MSDLFSRLAADLVVDDSPAHPVEWAKKKLGTQLWSKQREIADSLVKNKKTAVKSAHSTGKSYLAALLAAWWIDTHPVGEAFVVTTAPSTKQVHAILWEYIREMHRRGGLAGKVQLSDNWIIGDRLVGFGRKPQDYDQHAFQGIHRKYVLVILDEACGINAWLWTAAETITTSENCRILAIGNPDDPSSQFAEICKPGSTWNKIKISVYDSPNFTGEDVTQEISENLVDRAWVEDKEIEWGEGHPYWTSKILAEFPEVDEFSTIPLSWILDANARWERWVEEGMPESYGRQILGVDVARYGTDKTVIAHRKGNIIQRIETFSHRDTESVADLVLQRMRGLETQAIIDTIGVGSGVYDKLRRKRLSVVGFNAGSRTSLTSSGGIGFVSIRAAAWWGLREKLDPSRDSNLCIPAHERLTAELIAPRWRDVVGGKIAVEGKEDVRKRLRRSTDHADAIIMALWVKGMPISLDGEEAFSWSDGVVEEGAFNWEGDDEWEGVRQLA